jgi:L-alanine-DL-glutamate epimerase-like enolase superfamily enzyme
VSETALSSVRVRREDWALKQPFAIAGQTYHSVEVVVAELSSGQHIGRGEAVGVDYIGETAESMVHCIGAVTEVLSRTPDRQFLKSLLPPGGARNALDCALWDLESKQLGTSVWTRLSVPSLPVETVFTIGLQDTPERTAECARAASGFGQLKLKLDQREPVERVEAVRRSRPDARLIVDVNGAWSFDELVRHAPKLQALAVELVEQPLARGADMALDRYRSPVPLCADESCLDSADLDSAATRYGAINIKLDKTGGLSEALALADAATRRGLVLMVGNMLGTSLAMLPALVLAHRCRFVDLDGPALMRDDRPNGLKFQGGWISRPPRSLWGEAGLAG